MKIASNDFILKRIPGSMYLLTLHAFFQDFSIQQFLINDFSRQYLIYDFMVYVSTYNQNVNDGVEVLKFNEMFFSKFLLRNQKKFFDWQYVFCLLLSIVRFRFLIGDCNVNKKKYKVNFNTFIKILFFYLYTGDDQYFNIFFFDNGKQKYSLIKASIDAVIWNRRIPFGFRVMNRFTSPTSLSSGIYSYKSYKKYYFSFMTSYSFSSVRNKCFHPIESGIFMTNFIISFCNFSIFFYLYSTKYDRNCIFTFIHNIFFLLVREFFFRTFVFFLKKIRCIFFFLFRFNSDIFSLNMENDLNRSIQQDFMKNDILKETHIFEERTYYEFFFFFFITMFIFSVENSISDYLNRKCIFYPVLFFTKSLPPMNSSKIIGDYITFELERGKSLFKTFKTIQFEQLKEKRRVKKTLSFFLRKILDKKTKTNSNFLYSGSSGTSVKRKFKDFVFKKNKKKTNTNNILMLKYINTKELVILFGGLIKKS
jgi:hypothetical protein